MGRPALTVIEGGNAPLSPWQNLPQFVDGRSPFDRNEPAFFRLSKSALARMDAVKLRQPIYNAWTTIIGVVPPVNLASRLTDNLAQDRLISLKDASACFRGVKRSVGDDKHGWDFFVFILKPTWGVRYKPSLSCCLEWFAIPNDVVFAVYARLDQPIAGRYGNALTKSQAVRGIITHWHFVESDLKDPGLPVDYKERYRRRQW